MKWQQGDVIIRSINYEIEGEELDHLILAHGESGHTHQLVDGIGKLIMMNEIMHLQVFSETALLKHEEHSMKNTIKNFKTKENIPENYVKYLEENEKIKFDELTFDEIINRTKHETIFKKGNYKIGRVRERDHWEEESREVID